MTDDAAHDVAPWSTQLPDTIKDVLGRMVGRIEKIDDLIDEWADLCRFDDTDPYLPDGSELADACDRAGEAISTELSKCIAPPSALSDVLHALWAYRSDLSAFARHAAFAEDDGDDKEADRIYGCTVATHEAAVALSWDRLIACIVSLADPGSAVVPIAEPPAVVDRRLTLEEKTKYLDDYTTLLTQIVERQCAHAGDDEVARSAYGSTLDEDEHRLARLRASIQMIMAAS